MIALARECFRAVWLIAVLAAPAVAAKAPAGTDLFESEAAALSFTASLGSEWKVPIDKHVFGSILGIRNTRYTFRLGHNIGIAQLGIDSGGNLRSYEVWFQVVDKACPDAPATRTLARSLLEHTEPDFANDRRNINLIGSSADLVWPWAALHSGPGTQIGSTRYYFFKMNGFCKLRLERRPW